MKIIKALKIEDNRKALYAAMIFMMILILAFLLLSLDQPDPPLNEKVIEIEMAFEAPSGGGSPSAAATTSTTAQESAQEIDTQEEASVEVTSGKGESNNSNETLEPKPDSKPTVNSEFTLPNSNKGNEGKGDKLGGDDGVDPNKGDKGKGHFTVNKTRKMLNSGGIIEQSQEEGKVALDIWVNEKGLVYNTKYRAGESTTASEYLIGLAKKWALTMQYEKNIGGGNQKVKFRTFSFTKH